MTNNHNFQTVKFYLVLNAIFLVVESYVEKT